MNHIKLISFLTVTICLLPLFAWGQMELPTSPDSAKQCSICHYRWVSTFFVDRRGTPLAPFQEERVVGTRKMCLSCHDGSVKDTRDKICNDPGHRTGNIPSDRVHLPANFPLDDNGAMQCSTCHTPHAIKAREGKLVEFFLRAPNKNSSLCKMCHISTMGGPPKGNHPIEISINRVPPVIREAGGIFGTEKPNEIICETCHIPHGGINNELLVLSVEDPGTRSVLCEACHTKQPAFSSHQNSTPFSHPLDIPPGKAAHIPRQWDSGEPVFFGSAGELVCRTCHKPHFAEDREFLLVEHRDNDSFCTHCHQDQARITGSSHDLRKSAPEEKNVLNKQARETGPCAACHLVHRGVGNFMWARKMDNQPSPFCTSCHAQGECAAESLPGDFSHPLGLPLSEKAFPATLPLFDETGKQSPRGTISCSTCHDVHNPRALQDGNSGGSATAELFLRIPSGQAPSAMCIDCHREQGMTVNTKHNLQTSDRPFANARGDTPQDQGICSPCHVAHGAVTRQYLWPGPPSQANSVELPDEGEPHGAVMDMMCTACHSDAAVTICTIPHYTSHPAGLVFPESTANPVWQQFPLFSGSGSAAPDGDVSCATCHNPHQEGVIKRKEAAEGAGKPSFLRVSRGRKLCTTCHGSLKLPRRRAQREAVSSPGSEDATVHKPYREGKCKACHAIDGFNQFRQEKPFLCLQKGCHEPTILEHASAHEPSVLGSCTFCHNPHSSGYGKLLFNTADKLCSTCHPLLRDENNSPLTVNHKRILSLAAMRSLPPDYECSCCHNPEHKKDISAVSADLCSACHIYLRENFSQDPHQQSKEQPCTACHDPHTSPYHYQLRKKKGSGLNY